ncbi:MAG: peptide chain release factor N(5)-glutamine methyltransferase [Micavibrio aeruginosavorus]|uniref:Release factor glutamine methyltransferase n=1 Tax=Micavibrio aeruginosavorus TaxID=349221 RepID=A0A2W5A3Q4_9BACT|nr:MAG: peptide chain release factor N(5)-glutamine methyltransferase [Micavibrio aeruginosavorus]
METLDQMMRRIRKALEESGAETPALDARILMRQGGNFSDTDLIMRGPEPLSAELIEKIEEMLSRRLRGEPVSRIAGEREFWSLLFKVTPDTLDPRADTETLVEAALKLACALGDRPIRILDLGTGTGCIPIALLSGLPMAAAVAVDINPGALEVARANAVRHGVADRMEFRLGSWWEGIKGAESFDLITSNPPYIPESDIAGLAPDVRDFDPMIALTGGIDGFDAYKIILGDLKKHLACGGTALFEIGIGQEKELARLVDDSNMCVRDSHRDLGGVIRVVEITHGEK